MQDWLLESQFLYFVCMVQNLRVNECKLAVYGVIDRKSKV